MYADVGQAHSNRTSRALNRVNAAFVLGINAGCFAEGECGTVTSSDLPDTRVTSLATETSSTSTFPTNMQIPETFVDRLNSAIFGFVSRPENDRLRCGTGGYSTPFRGTLFGEVESAKVDAILQHTPVDVLWMGSNPNVPQSLRGILDPTDQGREFESFLRQRECGKFSEQSFRDGTVSQGWDPIHNPVGRGWRKHAAT